MSEWQLIRLDSSEDGVRLLTLDDPARHNAISVAMREELVDCAARLRADPDARVLVVTGAGRSFCSGADLLEVLGGPERDVLEMRNSLRDVYASFLELRALPIPTIAAVQGHAIGAGLNVAMSCDIRLAGPGARFGALERRAARALVRPGRPPLDPHRRPHDGPAGHHRAFRLPQGRHELAGDLLAEP
ncbi:MAG: enoyl-CoA hydratase-related protein, partial [Frankia sp.]